VAAVGLVLVSHSAKIAEGLVELARQMAPDAALVAAGGTDDGGIGTSFDKVEAAVREADRGDGVVLIGDLGSAILTAETVADLLDPPVPGGVRVLDVPLVEGGIAAAVAAQSGGDLDAVTAAARRGPQDASDGDRGSADAPGAVVALTDPEGLHARPAAELVKLVGRFSSTVRINGTDARSLLAVLALGLRQGSEVRITAEGPDAADAVEAVRALLGPGSAPA
jgi:phosphoenolpyruvate---glycerone phosphotransferase subunit DhaM